MTHEIGSILEKAVSDHNKKNMGGVWRPMSEFTYTGQLQIMIAAKDLIDPITNPEGVGIAYINNGGEEFIAPVFERHSNVPTVTRFDKCDITHFIEIKGPY